MFSMPIILRKGIFLKRQRWRQKIVIIDVTLIRAILGIFDLLVRITVKVATKLAIAIDSTSKLLNLWESNEAVIDIGPPPYSSLLIGSTRTNGSFKPNHFWSIEYLTEDTNILFSAAVPVFWIRSSFVRAVVVVLGTTVKSALKSVSICLPSSAAFLPALLRFVKRKMSERSWSAVVSFAFCINGLSLNGGGCLNWKLSCILSFMSV
jgi:hypothetical protein